MPINSNIKTHPVMWLVSLNEKGKLNMDISIQRQAVWSHLHQSNLIMTVMKDAPISNLLFEKIDDSKSNPKYNVIDGKQRTLTLCAFVNDKFALSSKMRYKLVETEDEAGKPITLDVTGKKFSGLNYDLRNRILQCQLSISVIDKMSAEDRAFVFFMGNQSVPLGTVNFLPVVLGEFIMEQINEITLHPFFTEKVRLTPAALRKRDDLKIIVLFLILRSDCDLGFSGGEIIAFCDMIRSGMEEVPREHIVTVLDYLDIAITGKRLYLRLMHVPPIMYLAQQAIDKNIDPTEFGERLDQFFTSPSNEFKEACLHGSSKKANVQARIEIMSRFLIGTDKAKPAKSPGKTKLAASANKE